MLTQYFFENRGFADINPISIGYEDCNSGYRFGPYIRQQYLIHYVEYGKGKFLTDDRIFELSAGDMFFIRPGELTTYEADPENPWFYRWVSFDTVFDLDDIFCKNVISSEKCGIVFSELCESEKYGENAEIFACGKIFQLIAMLRKRLSGSGKKERSHAQKAKHYIDTNYYREITVAGIASELGLDRSYLSTVFKELTGKSPKEYIVNLRLENAADLMKNHGFSPKQASVLCGYDDIFNFSKMFKRKYGVSPREYKSKPYDI